MNYLQDIWGNNHINIREEMEEEIQMKQKITKKECRKENEGITLVALVVTIVVLLILAGITITILFGDNGIIKSAQKAKTETEKDQGDTQNGLANLSDQMAQALGEDVSSLAKFIKSNGNTAVTKQQGNQELKDKSGKNIVIPVGFKITEDSATEIDKGVVVQDPSGNQFVWVPVPDGIKYPMFDTNGGKLYNIQGSDSFDNLSSMGSNNKEPDTVTYYDGNDATNPDDFKTVIGDITRAQFKTELQEEFNNMKASIERYKGFYIGRYEASNLSSSDNTAIPKVVKGVNPTASVNWYYMYKELQNIEKENKTNGSVNDDVKTSMIWGCQFDRTLIWLVESGNKKFEQLKDSTTWGNYSGTEFDYTPIGSETPTQKTGKKLIPTGSTEYTNSNNIYDLAGNLLEWSLEVSSTSLRVSRGGSYSLFGSFGPASYRGYYGGPSYTDNNIGTRPTLYVVAPSSGS